MSRATLFTALAISAALLTACTSVRPHARSVDGTRGRVLGPTRPGEASTDGDIGKRGAGTRLPAGVVGRAGVDSRRGCRTGSRPTGWIAVAYVSADEGECIVRGKNETAATAAILTYYANEPISAILDVCADEPAPRGWLIDDTPADASASCPGVERNGSSTYRIRRVR